jgi:hypothetical protein
MSVLEMLRVETPMRRGILFAQGQPLMKSSSPKWQTIERRLKERYQNLTDDDFKELRHHWQGETWLARLQQKSGAEPFEIAVYLDDVIHSEGRRASSTPLSLRRSVWA